MELAWPGVNVLRNVKGQFAAATTEGRIWVRTVRGYPRAIQSQINLLNCGHSGAFPSCHHGRGGISFCTNVYSLEIESFKSLALHFSGFKLNCQLHQVIVARFADEDLVIDFDNFVRCLIRLETLFSEYMLSNQTGSAALWFQQDNCPGRTVQKPRVRY